MLKLNFNIFIERLRIQREANKKCTLHYEELSDRFVLYFKNFEHWEYYCVVFKQDILNFGNLYEVTPEQAVADFKTNYLSDAVRLESEDVPIMTPEESEVIGKSTDPVVVEEAEDYGDFYKGVVDKWEERIIKLLNNVEINKAFQKTFGEFLEELMNTINTRPFLTRVKAYVKKGLVSGLESAEEELNVNITWSETFDNKMKTLEYQQLEGYSINGERWFGIKGATKQLQLDILKTVEEDVKNKVSREDMVKHVKEIFEGSTTSQAERIARTETNRFINEGKITGYKDSGIKGRKAWSVVPKKCCEICQRLHDKYFEKGIGFDDKFVDTETGKSFYAPPGHPHCRCVVEYRTIKV